LRRLLVAILCCLVTLNPARAATGKPVIVLVGASDVRHSMLGTWLELTYREAFRRLGYDFNYVDAPAKRATAMAEHGEVDGEIHRIGAYGKDHPDLVRVEESHFAGVFAAYASRPLALANGWDSLKNTSYRVEYRMGALKTEQELPPRVDAARLSAVNQTVLGLRKLIAGRTDIYIDGELPVDAALKSAEFLGAPIQKVAVMEQLNAHAFLHARHRALAGRLSATLAQMKREGLIVKYRQAAMDTQTASR
jgi:polar amino acid transport system substrate-binding protein